MVINERKSFLKLRCKNRWVAVDFLRKGIGWASDLFKSFLIIGKIFSLVILVKMFRMKIKRWMYSEGLLWKVRREARIFSIPRSQLLRTSLGNGSVRSYHLFCIRSGSYAFGTPWLISVCFRHKRIKLFQPLTPIYDF